MPGTGLEAVEGSLGPNDEASYSDAPEKRLGVSAGYLGAFLPGVVELRPGQCNQLTDPRFRPTGAGTFAEQIYCEQAGDASKAQWRCQQEGSHE